MASSAQQDWVMPESLDNLFDYVKIIDSNFLLCMFFTAFAPFYHNAVGRWDYNTRVFTRFFGSKNLACLVLSIVQLLFSWSRNFYFKAAVLAQQKFETPYNDLLVTVEYVLIAIGMMLVITSFLRLGWFGTYQGDHFGIYLDEKVTAFPFSVLDHPMYVGAVINFLGFAIGNRSFAGVALSIWLQIVYSVTESFEGPFTEMIYARKAEEERKNGAKNGTRKQK